MAGHPSLEVTERLIPALVEAGADAIELGVPFSDPLADGATVQEAGFHAVKQGVTLSDCVNLVARLRPKLPDTPLDPHGLLQPNPQHRRRTILPVRRGRPPSTASSSPICPPKSPAS